MPLYPVSLNIKNKRCVVVGGGSVAERKIRSLLGAQANVFVISPLVTDKIAQLYKEKKITLLESEYESDLIQNSFLVIAATDDRLVNEAISKDCEKNNILVNVIDSFEESNFVVNATIKQKDLIISVSTSGKSPALARRIKEELSVKYGAEYGVLLEILGEFRNIVKKEVSDEQVRREFFTRATGPEILDLIKQEKVTEAKRRLKSWL